MTLKPPKNPNYCATVVRIDRLQEAEAYKCKNFAFLERETKLLDAGESDIETEESLDFET